MKIAAHTFHFQLPICYDIRVTANIRRGILSITVFAMVCALYVWLGSRPGHAGRGVPGAMEPDPAAEAYAAALRAGEYDKVVDLTCWMQERLLRVQYQAAITENRLSEHAELVQLLRDKTLAGNVLRIEGVEDQYVFAPAVHVECVRVDPGRNDLERPTRSRTWLRVAYPAQHNALRNESGAPVKALTVGVNVSKEGYVLKANVIGNLDIDWTSISYDWD